MKPLQESLIRYCRLNRPEAKLVAGLWCDARARLGGEIESRLVLNEQLEEEEAELLIYGDIGMDLWTGDGVSAKSVLDQISSLRAKRLNVRINSGGGDVFEGFAIYNAIREYKGTARVSIDSIAASAAAVISTAADEVSISPIGMMMIHNAYGLVVGNAAEARAFADVLDKIDSQIAEAFRIKTKQPMAAIRKAMDAETHYTAAEAKAFGLVDMIREKSEEQLIKDKARPLAGAETGLAARQSARLAAAARLRILEIQATGVDKP